MKLCALIWFALAVAAPATEPAGEVLTERAERHALRDRAVELLQQEQFEALDALAGQLWSGRARFEDGSWRLAYFYESLDSLTVRFNTEAWQQHLARLQRWCEARPDSATARIVLARAWLSRSGSGAESSGKFKDAAEQALEQARGLPALDAEWHNARLRLGWLSGWDHARFEQAFREALHFEPAYHPFYVTKAGYLRATRPDAPQVVEQFAAQAADAAKDTEGDALYTRTLMWLLWSERDEFFDKYGVSWERMKRGFEKLQRQHPTSLWIANNFGMFACMAGDDAAARAQFQRIGRDWNPYVWRNEGRFEQWRAWAEGRANRPPKAERPRSLSRPYTGGPILDREVLMEQVAGLLLAQNYDGLEELGRRFRTNKERLPEGVWKLQFYYTALTKPPKKTSGGEEWTYWLELLEKWRNTRPASVTAPIALAGANIAHAWAGRGGEYAYRVTDEGWQLFRQRIAAARRLLELSEATSSIDPHWYTLMLRVARAQSWDPIEMQRLFERAIQREPAYHPHYNERALQLLPRWFGQKGDLESFALQVADSPASDPAEGLYARIAWAVATTAGDDNFFEQHSFSWPKIRDAFRQIETRYPDSNWNLNRFCWFACMAGDKETARELFERIGDRWLPECWKSEQRWRHWRQWAGAADSSAQR